MALLTIREIGDPILNKKAKEVKESSDRLQELIDDMFETMYEANGVGLAAGTPHHPPRDCLACRKGSLHYN